MDDTGCYLHFEKEIKGNVTVENYEGWIMIHEPSLHGTRGIGNETGQGKRDVGVVHFSTLQCTKESDSADAGMFDAFIKGTVLGTATIVWCQTSGESSHVPYKTLKLGGALIASYTDTPGVDSFEIAFENIEKQIDQFEGDAVVPGQPVKMDLKSGVVGG